MGSRLYFSRLLAIAFFLVLRTSASDKFIDLTQASIAQSNAPDIPVPGTDAASQSDTAHAANLRDRIFYPGDTERPKPLFRKLFLNIALDQKDFFTSPFHVNRHNVFDWLVPMAVTGGLIAADTHIADAFENSRGQVQWGGRVSNIGAAYTLIPIVGGAYVYGAWRDNAKAREIGVLGTESLLDGLIVAGVLKEVFRRNRPNEKNPGDFWGGGTSFPSGHAIEVWSIASLLAHEYKHQKFVGITAYSLAAIVSASRVAAQKHFASDIFVGGTMGWFIGRYVYDTHMSHLAHHHAFFLPMLVPEIEPFSRRYGLTLVFGGAGGRALPQEGSCSVARMGNYLSSRPDCGMMSRP
jgi:membrane-associated phospholipid phosphatase